MVAILYSFETALKTLVIIDGDTSIAILNRSTYTIGYSYGSLMLSDLFVLLIGTLDIEI